LVQKVYGARDERAVRLGVGLAGLALLVFAWMPPILGMAARAEFPDLASPDLALPTLFTERMPLLLGSLGLAAIFSAELSASDAALFMLATSLSRDLYLRFLRPDASDQAVLRAARLAGIAGGILGVAIALLFETVIDTLTIFYSILSVSLFVPVIAGIHLRRTRALEAIAAIGAGVATLLAAHWNTGGAVFVIAPPTLLGISMSAVVFGLARRVKSS
jgi:SSS family solute:Na+ symporter